MRLPDRLARLARLVLPASLVLVAAAPAPAWTSPLQFLPVGDPLEQELRILDLYSTPNGRLLRPHLGSRPLQLAELQGADASGANAHGARAIAARRLERALQRDAATTFTDEAAPHSTPRLLQCSWPGDERLELSAGLEATRLYTRADGTTDSRWQNGSGLHTRISAQSGPWLAYLHLFFGELAGVRAFSDVLVAGTDIAASTEDSYLAYAPSTQWSAQLGRSRWQWGPGEEGTLLLSGTSAPLTGLMLHARLRALHADGFIFNATVEPGRGEQLAAHRIEWQPRDAVRLGVTETARYHAGGWQGLYLAGALPYAFVQRLLDQDVKAGADTLRNNIMLGFDGSLRVADGVRLYGELLLDDLHAHAASNPNKYGFQAGLNGAGDVSGTRVSWNAEYSWLSRYVYSSFFGRIYSAQDRPTGFPTGPDARRFRARVTWDPDADWQLSAVATRTNHGEGNLLTAFVPGTPVPDVGTLTGIVERSRTLEGQLRYWPASGIDLSLRAGRTWVDDAGHIAGATTRTWTGAMSVQLMR